MTVEREQTLFGSTQMLHTNFGVHVVKNRRISPELVQTDPEEIWADLTLCMDRARQYEDQKIFGSSSPAKIILNTNKNVDRPIRFFSTTNWRKTRLMTGIRWSYHASSLTTSQTKMC